MGADPAWFGGRLRELREAAGLTQQQLADKERFKNEVQQQPLANNEAGAAEGDRAPGSAANGTPEAPASN